MRYDFFAAERGLELEDAEIIVVRPDREKRASDVVPDVIIGGDETIVRMNDRMRNRCMAGCGQPHREGKRRCAKIGESWRGYSSLGSRTNSHCATRGMKVGDRIESV